MIKLILLLLSLSVFACAPKNSPEFYGERTNKYDHILEQFNSDLEALGYPKLNFSQTRIYNLELGNITAARCHEVKKTKSGVVNISIDTSLKTSRSLIVLYHEIGHCFFGLGHSDKTSIMSARISGVGIQHELLNQTKRLEYLKEMLIDSDY